LKELKKREEEERRREKEKKRFRRISGTQLDEPFE
jgi:hypothetical protein